MKVVIVGGGIGGCALALSLHDAGITDVDVYEAVSEVRELGVGVNILPHAARELIELGLGDDLAASAIATAALVFFNRHGQRVFSEDRGIAAGYRWPQYSIHRGELLGILHRAVRDRLGAERYHTGHAAVRVGGTESRPGSTSSDAARVRHSDAPKERSSSRATGSTLSCAPSCNPTKGHHSGTASRCGAPSPSASRSSTVAR